MPKAQCTFRKRDVTAAVRAVVKAGVVVTRVEIAEDGKIVVVVTGMAATPEPANDLDGWMGRHAD